MCAVRNSMSDRRSLYLGQTSFWGIPSGICDSPGYNFVRQCYGPIPGHLIGQDCRVHTFGAYGEGCT